MMEKGFSKVEKARLYKRARDCFEDSENAQGFVFPGMNDLFESQFKVQILLKLDRIEEKIDKLLPESSVVVKLNEAEIKFYG